LFKHNPGSYSAASLYFLPEKCLDDEPGFMYKYCAVSYFSFTAFDTTGFDTKTGLTEMEINF